MQQILLQRHFLSEIKSPHSRVRPINFCVYTSRARTSVTVFYYYYSFRELTHISEVRNGHSGQCQRKWTIVNLVL